jgi:plastocyanin
VFVAALAGGALLGRIPQGLATEVRGTLANVQTLAPSTLPPPPRYRGSFWQTANGVTAVLSPRASVEFDVGVVVTGPGITDGTQHARARIEGGRCRPGTVVVNPGTVLELSNDDIVAHALYAVAPGQSERTLPMELTAAHTTRQVTFPAAGVFELRDERQPGFRCWVVVSNQQGRAVSPRADGSFVLPDLGDGDFTVRAYFEGAERASATLHLPAREPTVTLTLPAPTTAATPGAPAPTPAPAAPAGRR